MLIQRKDTVSSRNQEKLHKEGSGDKEVLKTTDNGFVKDKKLGVGEELWAKNIINEDIEVRMYIKACLSISK